MSATDSRRSPEQLRSFRWFGPNDLRTFGQRSRLRQMGLGPEDWVGKPVIAILNTWSEINPCHLHFKVLAENVKKGGAPGGRDADRDSRAVAGGKFHEAPPPCSIAICSRWRRRKCCAAIPSMVRCCSARATRRRRR
ncbi:MAG: hypothetical protein WDN28_26755 [Chthoniobacter sp.]